MKRLTFLLLTVCSTTALAAPPTQASIDALLSATKVERTLDAMMDQMTRVMQQQTQQMLAKASSPELQQKMAATQDQLSALFRSEMTWAKLEPVYVEVYQQTYTQEEIDGLTAFYRTPVGQSYVDKMPLALQKTLVAMQPMVNEMMQKAQAITQKAVEDAKAKP